MCVDLTGIDFNRARFRSWKIKDGVILDPNIPVDPQTGQPLDAASMDLGKPQMEPEIDASSAEPIEMPKGGEI